MLENQNPVKSLDVRRGAGFMIAIVTHYHQTGEVLRRAFHTHILPLSSQTINRQHAFPG